MGLLEELAVRCEAATGADREVDAEIRCALNGIEYPIADTLHGRLMRQVRQDCAECYTGSVDAAMTLIPDGEEWSLHKVLYDNKGCPAAIVNLELPEVLAMTPALALTAASLRARHALALSKGSEG